MIKTFLILFLLSSTLSDSIKFLDYPELDDQPIEILTASSSIGPISQKILNFAKSRAQSKSTGNCAKYVREAIQAGGLSIVAQPSAYMYGQNLINVGYKQIGCTAVPSGSVLVIENSSSHPHGHIEIKGDDGHYYSDFKQNSACPYSDGCQFRCYYLDK